MRLARHYVRRGRLAPETPLVEDSPDVRAAMESLGAMGPKQPRRATRRHEVARLVQVTLDSLPERYGDALEWKYIQGWSVDEIAGKLGVGPKAVESMLTRARQAFRDAFAALEHDDEAWGR